MNQKRSKMQLLILVAAVVGIDMISLSSAIIWCICIFCFSSAIICSQMLILFLHILILKISSVLGYFI